MPPVTLAEVVRNRNGVPAPSRPGDPNVLVGRIEPATPGLPRGVCDAWLLSVKRAVTQLGLDPDEAARALPGMLAEVERRLPAVAAALAVVGLLPLLRERFYRHYRGRGVPWPDAEDLSQTAAQRILTALFGSWPRGNVGAWLAKVRDNVGRDRGRRLARETSRTRPAGGRTLVSAPDRADDRATWEEWEALSARLQPDEWAAVHALWTGSGLP